MPAGVLAARWASSPTLKPLLPLPPVPYPAEGTLVRKVAANGLVSVWGNRYSVPPGEIGTEVSVRWRLGDPTIDVLSASGRLIASHRKVPRGQGRVVRLPQHTPQPSRRSFSERSPPPGPANPNLTGHPRQQLWRSPPASAPRRPTTTQ